jgi:hypothetical protein
LSTPAAEAAVDSPTADNKPDWGSAGGHHDDQPNHEDDQ